MDLKMGNYPGLLGEPKLITRVPVRERQEGRGQRRGCNAGSRAQRDREGLEMWNCWLQGGMRGHKQRKVGSLQMLRVAEMDSLPASRGNHICQHLDFSPVRFWTSDLRNCKIIICVFLSHCVCG